MLAPLHADDTAKSGRKPNIVLILADDLGYGDVGCYGATQVKTPNIDRLAAEGRRFVDAHAASAACSPSRYALLTGEYPWRKNNWWPLFSQNKLIVDPARATVVSLLKQQGYATSCFGKWHLGFGNQMKPDWNADLKPGPLEVGFDHFFGIPVVTSDAPFVWVEDHRVVGLDPADPLVYGGIPQTDKFPEKRLDFYPVSGGKKAHALYHEEEVGTTLTTKATAWMRQHQDQPFFLYFATPHIHLPFTPAPRFKGTSQCGRYGDYIHEFDWIVGEVMRTLKELKLDDHTIVILTSDNGAMLNQGGQDAWKAGHRPNGELLGFKFDSWEGGHRVPFIARWPGKIQARSVSHQLICNVDFIATFAALSGGALGPLDGPDSINILPALTGTPDHPLRDHLVLAPVIEKNLAIRQGRWVYIGAQGGGGFWGTKPGATDLGGPAALKFTGQSNSDVAGGRIKPDAPEAQLYDLAADPGQHTNVIRQHPEVAAKLQALLTEIRSRKGGTP